MEDGVNCQKMSILYEAKCQKCPDNDPNIPHRYIGMTGQNIHARSISHAKDVRYKQMSNSLYKHNLAKHSETHTSSDNFKFTRLSSHKDNISRLLTEAHQIYHAPDPLINSKSEYNASKWISLDAKKTGT